MGSNTSTDGNSITGKTKGIGDGINIGEIRGVFIEIVELLCIVGLATSIEKLFYRFRPIGSPGPLPPLGFS